jgi:signal transduction histidine kinase
MSYEIETVTYQAATRYVRGLRFALPISLFLLATTFEVWEHWGEHDPLIVGPLGMLEIFVFGVVGPTAVYLVLTYVERLLQTVQQAHTDIAQLNRELERKVADRTAELERANLRLRELDQMKSDFVSLVSHELRAPLATLNGGLEVALQSREQLPPKTERVFQLLLTETARLTDFVQTILDLTQLEAGKLHVHCGPVALKPLLRHAVAMTLGADAERVIWRLPSDLPPIWVDETYTEEVIRNLLRNAQKYTPPHSPIELEVTVEKEQMRLSVTDYGPGIAAEQQAQAFERFVRLPRHNGREQEGDQPRGWGLGLYFARMLLVQQRGSLTLQSPAHHDPQTPGSRFTLTLPLDKEEEGAT